MHELDAALVEQATIGVVGGDDDEMPPVEIEMALDQRQRAAPDRAEADHHDRAVDPAVSGPLRHGVGSPAGWRDMRAACRLKARAAARVNRPEGAGGIRGEERLTAGRLRRMSHFVHKSPTPPRGLSGILGP